MDIQTKPWPLFRSLHGAAANWRMDVLAGLTLAAIAAPEQMATARLGGFEPYVGFFVFIAGSLGFALLGGNRYLSAGADSTITPIFAASLALLAATGTPHYQSLAALLAILVGVMMLGAGFFRAGWVANLLSIPVLTGFLGGIAVHIAVSQAPSFLGLPGGSGNVVDRLDQIVAHIGAVKPAALLTGLVSLAAIIICEKLSPRIPGALLALGGATLAAIFFGLEARGLPVVGPFAVAAPHLAAPQVSIDDFLKVVGLAAIIALVVMVQSAATSRSFPGEEGEAPDIDRDYLGLGAGSLLSGLFGAFPVNASPPRTAIVAENGGKSQIAGLAAAGAVVGARGGGGPDRDGPLAQRPAADEAQ